ncbi:MAG: cobalamin-independent methionine synthase II family protein [Pseudomonadota bacterium]
MRQVDRILTTHIGSLPRSEMVSDVVSAAERGTPVNNELYDAVLSEAVDTEVERQKKLGIDIVSDGEFSKVTYASYVQHRLTGFSGNSPLVVPADLDEFPVSAEMSLARRRQAPFLRSNCTGPVAIKTSASALLDGDIRRMQQAVEKHAPKGAFMTSASPGLIAIFHPNKHYPKYEAYLVALAEAMKQEYQAIIAGGFDLQIDCPDLAMGRHTIFKQTSEAAFLRQIESHVSILNAALAGLPPERMRIYISWGNYEGPHVHDIALEKILPIILRAKPAQIAIEAATPGHQHEWRVFEKIKLPDDKILLPGVIDTTNNYVEHPEVVADRIERFARVVGRERVIASTDSGFAAFAGDRMVDPKVAFYKLQSLVQGAGIATRRLWP